MTMNQNNKNNSKANSKTNDSSLNLERRNFVKQASLGAAAVALSPLAAPYVQAQNGNNKVLKVGVVGLGGRGSGAMNNILQADPNTKIWAVADIFEKRIKGFENRNGARIDTEGKKRVFLGFDGYQKVIDSGVDIVILATPPVFRPQHFAASIAAGKHVFMEKPFANDIPGLKSVVDNAKKAQSAGLSVMTGLVWRYSPHLMELHKRIQGGEIGDVLSVSSTYCGGRRPNTMPDIKFKEKSGLSDMEWALKFWQNYLELSGDGIMEFMIHGLDKMSWAMGDQMPEKCMGMGANIKPVTGANNWDQFALNYQYADGRRADFMGRQIPGAYAVSGDSITGSKGFASLNKGGAFITKDGKVVWQKKGGLGYKNEHQILMEHIRSGKVFNDVLGKMEHSHALAIMGRTASYTGQLVTKDQIMSSTDELIKVEGLNFDTPFAPRPAAEVGVTKFS